MIEPEKVNWWVSNSLVNPSQILGPYDSQAKAWLTVINKDGIPESGSFVWCTLKKTESKQKPNLIVSNDFKNSNIFPCDVIPKKRSY